MIRILTSSSFAALAGGLAYLATTFACFSMAKLRLTSPSAYLPDHSLAVESWHFKNPEMDEILREIQHQREHLARRAEQLHALEIRLHSERQEIATITQAVFQIQQEIHATVSRITSHEAANLKKLAKIHAGMSPDASARILKELQDEEIVKIMHYLKPGDTGAILEAFGRLGKTESTRAANLTTRLRRTFEEPPAK